MSELSPKEELKSYGLELSTQQKIDFLKLMVDELNEDLTIVSAKQYRAVILAKKQVLMECLDILEKYNAVKEAIDESNISN